MAQPTQPHQQRPSFSQSQQSSYQHQYQPPNSRPQQFSPQSPQTNMAYSSPSPQPQFSPSFPQAPPSKRPRLSPDAPSPFSQAVSTPQAASPVTGPQTNGSVPSLPRMGSMPPPQRPPDKEDRDFDDVLKQTGINLDDEFRNLSGGFFGQPTTQSSFQSGQGSFESYPTGSFGQQSTTNGSSTTAEDQPALPTPEDRQARQHQRLDWESARHSQHELWDPFLQLGTLNDRIKTMSQRNHLVDPQSGVLVNTQKNAPPPSVRVNGLEGATKVINNGQSILDTREKAERLNELIKLLSLSAKARLTGLLHTSARLALERRETSKGRIPDEWSDIAVPQPSAEEDSEPLRALGSGSAMKRTHSQANGDDGSYAGPVHLTVSMFEKMVDGARSAEEARRAKRDKRKSAPNARDSDLVAAADQDAAIAAALDPDRKTTKKERKAAESKISERQQHASTNEAARMATAGLLGRLGGKKSKNYSWMTGGGSAPSSTPGTPSRQPGTPLATPSKEKVTIRRGRPFNQWDEDRDAGIQVRDVLLVLESDGKASRSYVKGSSLMDEHRAP